MKKKATVDAGKFNTKGYTKVGKEVRRTIFRTKATPTEEIHTPGDENFVVSIPNLDDKSLNKVIIGRRASDDDIDYDKEKKKDIHKIAIYTALANLIESGDVLEEVVIGYPIDLFKNVKARNEYMEFIKGDGKIEMMIDGKPFNFTIEKVIVLPETSGIILKNYEDYRDKTIAVLDWGGLNVNGCIFQNGDPVEGTYFVINKGVNILKNELKHALNQEFKSNLQDYSMDEVLKDGYIPKDPEASAKFIHNFIHDYIKHIKEEAKRCQWDFENLKHVLGTGGGSLQFEKQLKEAFSVIKISKNAVWDNAEGWGEVLGI